MADLAPHSTELHAPRPRPPIAPRRPLPRPPGGILLAVITGTALLSLYESSLPGAHPVALVTVVWPALAVLWAARLVAAVRRRQLRASLRRHWLRWAAAPTVVALAGTLILLGLPLHGRLAGSEPDLSAFARSVAEGTHPARGDRWVGMFHLTRVERLPGGSRFLISGAGGPDPTGFAWSPNGPPPRIGPDQYRHLDGPWYIWTETW